MASMTVQRALRELQERGLTYAVVGSLIRKFIRTARRYRTIQIQAGDHTITAADPLPDDLNTPSTGSTTVTVRTKLS